MTPKLLIPKPLLVTVDDVGWWNGLDGSACNQPFRTGMLRNHVPEDYRALAALGSALNMRIPAGFILCEWDATNLLRKLPSATWMGDHWQNPFENLAQKEEAIAILADSRANIEPALHGLGHEFWRNGILDGSEFHNAHGSMRPPDEVKRHLEYFFKLLAMNHLDTGIRLFIPPALNHSFGNGNEGFQHIANSFGIRYVTLAFSRARCHAPPQFQEVGWENQVVLMDRGLSPVAWNRVAAKPEFNPDQPILPLHWANLLHTDPQKNMEVVSAWIRAIQEKIEEHDLVPARDMAHCLTQFLHHTRSIVLNQGREISVRMDWIHELPASILADELWFNIPDSEAFHIQISGARRLPIDGCPRKDFYRTGRPLSGRMVFRFSHPDI